MAITNRDLPEGTRLAANYKKQAYVCVVEKGEEGKPAFVLEDGRRFKSPSSAASAVMGGSAANGWRFWSLEGEAPAAEPAAEKEKAKGKSVGERSFAEARRQDEAAKPKKANGNGTRSKLISRTPNQKGVPEGEARWFCNGCMASFVVEGDAEPEACPQGHRADDPELTAPAGVEA